MFICAHIYFIYIYSVYLSWKKEIERGPGKMAQRLRHLPPNLTT